MPELPEVETTVRGLARVLEGRRLTRVEPRRADFYVVSGKLIKRANYKAYGTMAGRRVVTSIEIDDLLRREARAHHHGAVLRQVHQRQFQQCTLAGEEIEAALARRVVGLGRARRALSVTERMSRPSRCARSTMAIRSRCLRCSRTIPMRLCWTARC